MLRQKEVTGAQGKRSSWLFLMVAAAMFFLMTIDSFSQATYEFSLRNRRMGDQIGVELWVKSLSSSAPKLGSFSFSVTFNTSFLQSAALTYDHHVTDSVDYDADQSTDNLPYREITSPFHNTNGYNAIIGVNGSGYAELEITFAGDETTQGYQPATTGRGSFVGRLIFDIINHATLSSTDLTGIAINTSGTPAIVVYDVTNDVTDPIYDVVGYPNTSTNLTLTDPPAMYIQGISILNPNGPNEVVNRSMTYQSLSVAGYPVYFERSGLVNPASYAYATDGLAYSMKYSLDGGTTWSSDEMRFAETVNTVTAIDYDNMASGNIETKNGTLPDYTITKGTGAPLTGGGDGYGGVLRVIWDDNKFFPYRSESARLKITQLATTGSGSDIDDRAEGTIFDISDADFQLSSLFFVQLDGTDDYLKTSSAYSNSTQLTVEAWVNLNTNYGEETSERGIIAHSAGEDSDEEGDWMLYLKNGRYPAFRCREINGRGTNGYIADVVSPDTLSVADAAISLTNSAASETHRQNWVHLAATVENNVVTLYINGLIVAQETNNTASDIRMKIFNHPIWVGVNPNISIEAADYTNMGIKEMKVWRYALTPDQILENASGVYDPVGDVVSISEPTQDVRSGLDIYYTLAGSKTDQAYAVVQNGATILDFYNNGSVDNTAINYRPDRAHIKIISPVGGEGVSNLLDETFTVKWVGFGLGSIDPNSEDISIEYSRNGGSEWADAIDNTVSPDGMLLDQVELEDGQAIWEPYNSVTTSGLYHDLQGVGSTVEENYTKSVMMRVRGTTANGQNDIYDASDVFYVAPYFAMENGGDAVVYVEGTADMNLSPGTSFIELWINPYEYPSDGTYAPLVSKMTSDGTGSHYQLKLLSTGQLQFDVTDKNGVTYSATSDSVNLIERPIVETVDSVWTHIGVYLNLANGSGATSIRFYVDGVPQYADSITTQLGSDIEIDATNTYPTYLGSVGTDLYKGRMREFRFWNGDPAGMGVSGTIETKETPSDLTKFVQGSQSVRASNLLITPTNYQENLVASFSLNGGTFVNSGINRTIQSETNSDIKAYITGDIEIGGTGFSYVPTKPYIKIVEPIYDQIVPNSETALRVRWVGFDYDEVDFNDGAVGTEYADLEFSIEGGGGLVIKPYQAVASGMFDAAQTESIEYTSTDVYRFPGVTDAVQYAAALNVSMADPDLNDDGSYDDQGAIDAAKKNARFRFRGRSTINSEAPWEYTDISSLRTEGPLFYITPPSNFTTRVLLEGFHQGSDAAMNDIGDSFDNLGIKISLWTSISGSPYQKQDSAESINTYDNDETTRSATTSPVRGSNGSYFANVPFIFTELDDGNYFVVVEHLNHLPIMSKYVAPFFYEGDDLTTWAIESGWDFQSWGQSAATVPATGDTMSLASDDIYSGNGLFSAYGETEIDEDEAGYDKTGLVFNQGQETTESNMMAAMVAGDVVRDGQVNASDRIQVREDAGATTKRSDVTGDGQVNALDRDIVDRNSNKISSLADLTVVTYDSGSTVPVPVPMLDYISSDDPLANVSVLDPQRSELMNNIAREFIANGSVRNDKAYLMTKGYKTQATGFNYKVYATPQLNADDGYIDLAVFIQNNGSEFAPGNCTFALKYNPNQLKYTALLGTGENPFNANEDKGYYDAYSAPQTITQLPRTNVRTIEIDYEGYARPAGILCPTTSTQLGVLRFEILNPLDDAYKFSWDNMTIVLTTDGKNITGDGTFDDIDIVTIEHDALVTNPNGGETYRAGGQCIITWDKPTNAEQVYVEFSTDAGSSWSRITENPIDVRLEEYYWDTPRINSPDCLIRLINSDTGEEEDRSNNTFSLSPAPAEIVRPASADPIYTGGLADMIEWSLEDAANIRFEFSPDGEGNWVEVTGAVNSETGETDWVLPNVNTKYARVRMVEVGSDQVMTISEPFVVLSGSLSLTGPAENQEITGGTNQNITWDFNNISLFDLHLSTDCGETWSELARDVSAIQQSQKWVVNNVDAECAIIRAVYKNDPDMEYSRVEFKIIPDIAVDENEYAFKFNMPAPNPFADRTRVQFELPYDVNVNVVVFNGMGEIVATLASNQMLGAGTHTLWFEGSNLSSGVYYIHINAGPFNMAKPVTLMK